MGKKGQIQSYSGRQDSSKWLGPVVYLAAVWILAALLGVVLSWTIHPAKPLLFSHLLNRALLISSLVCLVPWLWMHWASVGLDGRPQSAGFFIRGAGLGCLCSVIAYFVHRAAGYQIEPSLSSFSHTVLLVLGALIVAMLEEVLFRGAIQTVLVERIGYYPGWLLGGAFFAAVHFLKVPDSFNPHPASFMDGFRGLSLLLPAAHDLPHIGLPFLSLWLLGLILGLLFLRSKNLWISIGMHFFVILTLKFMIFDIKIPDFHGPLSSSGLLSSSLTPSILLLVLIGLWRFYHPLPRNGRVHCST